MAAGIRSVPTGNPYIDGILYGTQWSGRITYSFPDAISDYGADYGHPVTGFSAVSKQQKDAIQSILEGKVTSGSAPFTYGSFAQISNVQLALAANPAGKSDIMIGQADHIDGANLPTAEVLTFVGTTGKASDGDLWFGNDYAGTFNDYRTPQLGTYAWLTHIHEIGHALGLSHGHDAGTDIDGFKLALPQDRDSIEFSVMTYRSFLGGMVAPYSAEEYGSPQTLMMSDIAAIQHLYGANFSTNAGSTVYTWSPDTGEMFVNGKGQGAPGDGKGGAANRVFLTIWDGGGNDTYDFSNYDQDAFIDLAPGSWSLVSQYQRAQLGYTARANGNVYNALQYEGDTRSLIENARGGSAKDDIAGNAADNRLYGNNGNDILTGRAGNDRLSGGYGDDILYGDNRAGKAYLGPGVFFEPGGLLHDTRASALSLDKAIGMRHDPNIQRSDTNPTVKVSGSGDWSMDFYSFTVRAAGQVILDTDGTMDSHLQLIDSRGNILTQNEDSASDPGDEGYGFQSFISFTVTKPGLYYVRVSLYPGDGVLPAGARYTLNVTLPNPVEADPLAAGDDILNGGAGKDVLVGGAGNDTYVLGAGRDTVIDSAGIDTITSMISRSLVAHPAIENLWLLGTGGLTGRGNALDNVITGNIGNDVLDGGAGRDTLIGGAGDDSYVLGAEKDRIEDSAGNDTITSTISRSLTTYPVIENLRLLGDGDINGHGNASNNTITGNSGNNLLDGAGGRDRLIGGAGNDTYVLSAGSDRITDTSGNDTITSTITRWLGHFTGIENLTLIGDADAKATGSAGSNRITGNASDNIIDGRAGNDYLTGGGGRDVFVFSTRLDAAKNVDKVLDFTAGDDLCRLDSAVFTALGSHGVLGADAFVSNGSGKAEDARDRIVYERDTGDLLYDANGSAKGGATQFAKLAPHLSLSHSDFFII